MEVNENVYGASTDWIDAIVYPEGFEDDNKVKFANFGDDDPTIYKAMIEDIIPLGDGWDKSLSYCALGREHPLSRIRYYYYDGEHADPYILKVLNEDNRDITNFALGADGSYNLNDLKVITVKGTEYSDNKVRYNRYTNGAEYNSGYSGYKIFKPLVKLPVKRCVLIPFIKAYDTTFSTSNDADLDTYLNEYKITRPYITQIYFNLYIDRSTTYDPIEGTGTPLRSGLSQTTCGCILDPTTYGNGYEDPSTAVSTDDTIVPIISNVMCGSLFDKTLPANQGTNVWCVPVADGFGLDFSNIYLAGRDGEISDSGDSRFYCDAGHYSADVIRESVRNMTACYGMFFTDSVSDRDIKLDAENMHLGVLEDGVGHGEYVSGAANRDQLQWALDDLHEIEYDPSDPPSIDPNDYNGYMSSGVIGTFGTATERYNISITGFTSLTRKLWDCLALLPSGDPLGDYCLDTFLTTNPIDSIVSLKYFPIKESMSFGTATTVHLGKYDTEISCYNALNQLLYDCGTKFIYPRFGKSKPNWLDRMTTITLYLPFCGTLSLDPDKYMGRWVGVEYAIDLGTGNCSAFVYTTADNTGHTKVFTDIASGTCGIDLPVTGIQHITLDSQLYNATEQLKSMRINNAVNGLTSLLGLTSAPEKGLTGGLSQLGSVGLGLYNSLHSEEVAEYNLEHTQLPVKMIGTAGSTTGAMCGLTPTIIIERPVVDVKNNTFGHTNGFACCVSDTISNFTGYTEFANADLSGFAATAAEKATIMSALKSGVIL